MKTDVLLIATVTAVATFTSAARADHENLSPRGRQFADDFRKVAGTTEDMLDRSGTAGSPKGIAFAESLRTVPNAGGSIDFAHGPRPLLSPKDPRYAQAWHELAHMHSEVAPLK